MPEGDRDPGLRVEATDHAGVFRITGELDAHSADRLSDLEVEGAGLLVLDMSGVPFVDSSGLRAIFRLWERLGEGGRLVLRNPADPVRRLFDLTRIDAAPGIELETTPDEVASP